ncbi:LacI family transcriptional regulator [Streptacidiphilus sp. PB12-B1b]|uniref:LacI family DNA-binding transcriptional regulator n=1 Tax=Streptacidiphilus TaxID=228398 RepID=UPI0005A878B6|nr:MULTISPECIES: LacI family DNA-binding transcriptional regulator [Streptacidiphilus]QMU78415.1 LacI family transcriptional regulator [Streptacidiphilus sp. PB12-B1b]
MGRTVGIKEVARQAGVSVGTVSNVINHPDLVSADTRARIQAVIARLGYVRSESARQLRAGRSRVMALLVLDMGNPFFVDVARGAEKAAREAGLIVMMCNSGQDAAEEAAYLSHFAQQQVLGVLLSPVGGAESDVGMLRRSGIPVVLVDRGAGAENACSVSVDDVLGGALAARHLIETGHTELVFVGGPKALHQVRSRLSGARQALAEAGLPPEALTVIETGRPDIAAGRDAGQRLLGLSPRPTAVFCANDLLAIGMLQSLFAAGIRIPEDVALIGYDDIEFAGAAAVPITSVRQPAFQIGLTSAELLIAESFAEEGQHQHRQVVYQPELVVRASTLTPGTGPPRLRPTTRSAT